MSNNSFGAAAKLRVGKAEYEYFRLAQLEKKGVGSIARLPFSTRILLENLLRHEDGRRVTAADVNYVAQAAGDCEAKEISFMPARVLLQDFTGVPCVVDLAAMRDALGDMGADPKRANPLLPADLVIDHSVQVDAFGTNDAFQLNALLEFQRNKERYMLLRWGQTAFRNFRVVPPDTGIVHQVNLEYLASVVFRSNGQAYPDSVVGTDSHTTMINGLGVLGWGVGGIEAEACMLGQPISMLLPPVVGFKLHGKMREGTTATDLVLTITQMLRKKGVVGKFVEFYGTGLSALALADRATVANMAPEYGATMGFFPVDQETLEYLKFTNRDAELVALVEAYTKEQGLFRTDATPDPVYADTLELDLATVTPSMAGPKRPQDRVELPDVKKNFAEAFNGPVKSAQAEIAGQTVTLKDGSVVIAAITSCTNTSNPSVMLAAGLLAKKAVERGLQVKPWVKTSLAPGSKVVMDYYRQSGLLPYLEQLKFHLVGFGCTTCIGNSGPLPEPVAQAVQKENLVAVAVLSGNRNFEGRVNSQVKANYLASPPLVVAYALAGRIDIDLMADPLGHDQSGNPVYLRDIWPSNEEVRATVRQAVGREMFQQEYARAFDGDSNWSSMPIPAGEIYHWDALSTYIKKPPYFEHMVDPATSVTDLSGMRVLALLGDSVTTDHISPAGNIPKNSPAGQYLIAQGVDAKDFNSYGARRGNHEVMVRGTLANIRLRNQLAPGTEGGYTVHLPDGEGMFIYDASVKYQKEGVPLMIIAGKEYGSGSSRDWAAKGVLLLGVKAVIAESFERIHRTNLVGMGVLPLQFQAGDSAASLKLTGKETFQVTGVRSALLNGGKRQATVRAVGEDGKAREFTVDVRVDTPQEVEYYRYGGILPYVLQQVAAAGARA
ncbi:MAG TPA: aconitate hydratase AcnA [Bryobacteraceae bacterium]|jgi:aconitate hydratase|nr:aconitate hydratase AcnA [Bryobacteraceae bacterium]